MRWFFNNMQILLPVLFVIVSLISRKLKSVVEQKHLAESQRGGARPSHRDPAGAMLQPAEASAQNRPTPVAPNDLAAQRQAQIEMWRARQAALGGQMQSASSPGDPGGENELANRRRLAMEELRRRQVQIDQMRSRQPGNRPQPIAATPIPPRQATRDPAQRRQAAPQRRNAPPAEQPAQTTRSSIIGEVVAATAAHPQPRPHAVPASRSTAAGMLVLNSESLRQAFIMKELLDPPLALRDNSAGFGAGYDQSG